MSLFVGARHRVARILLTGELFLADSAKDRGATASASALVFAALAAIGANLYRLWASTGATNRRLAYGRAFLQRMTKEFQFVKTAYDRQSARAWHFAGLPVVAVERYRPLRSRIANRT